MLEEFKPIAKPVSLISSVVFGVEIVLRTDIGSGLLSPHSQGTAVGPWRIGEDSVICQGTILGAEELDFTYNEHSRPTLDDNVAVGTGVKVLGSVGIGIGARVGVNAVAVTSVPPNIVTVEVPAKAMDTWAHLNTL